MAQFSNVPKMSLGEFFKQVDGKFVFPDYQRPYSWDEEQTDKLFTDIADFTFDCASSKNVQKKYFLGAIIARSTELNLEIIDGRQRITSLILLLRVIYDQLANGVSIFTTESEKQIRDNLGKRIESILWQKENVDFFSGVSKCCKDKPKIDSRVLEEKDVKFFFEILKTGNVNNNSKDKYSKNYLFFKQKLADMENIQSGFTIGFLNCLLDNVEVVVISADDQDTALTIFSTLNDSGLPLSDADIFKAIIYGNIKDKKKKKEFIDRWNKLSKTAEEIEESLQKIFYYYMMVCRARLGDVKTSMKRLRDYFKLEHKELLNYSILDDLQTILNFFQVVKGENIGEKWSNNREISNMLDCLVEYSNEFWKYPVITFYLQHQKEETFEKDFLNFLKMLIVKLATSEPSVTAIKSDVMNLSKSCVDSNRPEFRFKDVSNERIKKPASKMTRMFLKILAYNEQDDRLPNFQIEHIFPQKWQSNYIFNIPVEKVKEWIEHLGNKIPLEKKLNIKVSNNYYDQKKKEYQKSSIKIAKKMSEIDNWEFPDDIMKRDRDIEKQIEQIFEEWEKEYKSQS